MKKQIKKNTILTDAFPNEDLEKNLKNKVEII